MQDKLLRMAASRLNLSVPELVDELRSANIHVGTEGPLSLSQKQQLTTFLTERLSNRGGVVVSQIQQQKIRGRSNIKVSVRKVRTIRRAEQQASTAPASVPPERVERPSRVAQDFAATVTASIGAGATAKPAVRPIEAKVKSSSVTASGVAAKPESAHRKRISAGKPQARARSQTEQRPPDKLRPLKDSAADYKRKRGMRSPIHAPEQRAMDKHKNYIFSMDSRDEADDQPDQGGDEVAISVPKHAFQKPTKVALRKIELAADNSVADLAQKMAVKASRVLKVLQGLGVEVEGADAILDRDTSVIAVEEMGHTPVLLSSREEVLTATLQVENGGDVQKRPPVVTIMGHVDHGKTTLLDTIRKTTTAAGEAGGITQRLSACKVRTDDGTITFVDTPGHAAFTTMRARGAVFTDIVVLVVAADDGVKQQTEEIIQHVRAAGVSLLVAINKMDKPGADVEKVLSELSRHQVVTEEWGGDVPVVKISALGGEGMEDLLESILLQAELLELEARPKGPATGVVLECGLDKGKGIIASVLVQSGELEKGDFVLAGHSVGRVRLMTDEHNNKVRKAGPSDPVSITGFADMPIAGDEVVVVASERTAREMAEIRRQRTRQEHLDKQKKKRLDSLFEDAEEEEINTVHLVVKADTHGSLEAMQEAFEQLSTETVKVELFGRGVGGINESDATLAMAHNAIIIGFNVRADGNARAIIEREGIGVHYYSIIYEAIDRVKLAVEGSGVQADSEQIVGIAEVREVFQASKYGQVAGCVVVEGSVRRNNPIRVLREEVVIYEGVLESLRRLKEDVNEVRSGVECGIAVKNYKDVRPGDKIEVFERNRT